ncbi:MAG: hypothetical protein ABSH50_33330 [Bryobacteraceae bacterium]|jgi:hypothetical protein
MPTRRLTSPLGPKVGIFWFIQELGQAPTLLGSGVAIGNGELYGEFINYPGDHSRYWLEINSRLPQSFHQCGPKDWPRGRVIYDRKTQRFEVYLNEQLQTPNFEAEILAYFNLPAAQTSFASDPHYVEARFQLDTPERRRGGP